MSFLSVEDTISGREGRAYATIDEKREEMFYIKKIEAKVEKQKAEMKMLGRRGIAHKATGWSGSGSMTIYYVTPVFRKMMFEYIDSGKDTYFDIAIINEDPTASIGKQMVTLNRVNLNSIVMASLDTEADVLEEEVEFTFEGVNINNEFTQLEKANG